MQFFNTVTKVTRVYCCPPLLNQPIILRRLLRYNDDLHMPSKRNSLMDILISKNNINEK